MVKVFSSSNFLVVKNPFLFVAPFAQGGTEPEGMVLELAAEVAANATSLTLQDPLTDPVWEGQKLHFQAITNGVVTATSTVTVSQDADTGDTEIKIKKVSASIAATRVASPYIVQPVYGVMDFSRKGKQKNTAFEHWNSSDSEEGLVLNRSWSYSMSALLLVNTPNPGLDLIESAAGKTGAEATLYFEYHREDNGGYKGFANIEDPSESGKARKEVELQYTFTGTGRLYGINEVITIA